MKKAEMQEQEFLEVCSSYDHDLLTGKREMTLITCKNYGTQRLIIKCREV